MTLGEAIKKYCDTHGLSIRKFALRTGLTHGYISMLVNGMNPKTKQPIVPTIETYAKISSAMDLPLRELFEIIDDSPVQIKNVIEPTPEPKSGIERDKFNHLFEKLSEDNQNRILDLMQVFLASQESAASAHQSDD